MRKFKNKLSLVLALALVFTLMVGTLAFFTDRVTERATVSTLGDGAINVDPDPIVDPDDPDTPPFVDPTPDDPSDDITNLWAHLNSGAIANFNPGDKMDLSFVLKNKGKLAVDVRETFVLTSSVQLSETPEFRLFSAISQDADTKAYSGTTVVAVEEKVEDGKYQYKYTIVPSVLSSSTETIDAAPTQLDRDYYVVFSTAAGNAFQGATCSVDYLLEVKQHSADAADWTVAASGQIATLGPNGKPVEVPAVPAA